MSIGKLLRTLTKCPKVEIKCVNSKQTSKNDFAVKCTCSDTQQLCWPLTTITCICIFTGCSGKNAVTLPKFFHKVIKTEYTHAHCLGQPTKNSTRS